MSIKVFTDAFRLVREAADRFDKAHGYSTGFLVKEAREEFMEALGGVANAMLAVRNTDRAKAEARANADAPDYKELALIFGTALGAALRGGNGYRASNGARCTDAALREIFKIEVDKPAE